MFAVAVVCWILGTISADVPILVPNQSEHVKYTGDSLLVSCRSTAANELVWLAPNLAPVTSRNRALRVEGDVVDADEDTRTRQLILAPISRHHSGRYTCRGTGADGVHETSFQLVVLQPITFRSDQVVQYAARGSNFMVRCDVKGDPVLSIRWQAWGRELEYGPESKHDIDPDGSHLIIRNVSDDDAGKYRCVATQITSKDSSVDYFDVALKIQYGPQWQDRQDGNVTVYSFPGRTVRLTCQATAEPAAVFVWYQHGSPLLHTDHHFSINDTANGTVLQFPSITPDLFGEYVCRAVNQISFIERTIHLKEADIPPPPQWELVGAGSTWLLLNITNTGASVEPPIKGYRVHFQREIVPPGHYSTLQNGSSLEPVPPVTESAVASFDKKRDRHTVDFNIGDSYVIDQLDYEAAYGIRVASLSEAGCGEFGALVTRRTASALMHSSNSHQPALKMLWVLLLSFQLSTLVLL